MVTEMLTMDNAPLWLNVFIWMATFWWYILIGFVPAFYIAVAKLFGMPLLQRWSNEVVIMLYPSKVKFGKITQQMEPYFGYKKGIYWMDRPLQPKPYEEMTSKHKPKLDALRERYEILLKQEVKTKKEENEMKSILKQQSRIQRKVLSVNPINQLHIYTHAVNQPIYNMERRTSKVDEILNNEPNPKKIPNHGIWLLQNPRLHFHRHYQLVINPEATEYVLVPVKERQQFSIGFWHSIGIEMLERVETQNEIESESGGAGPQLISKKITTNVVLQKMKYVQDYQNFSASRAYMLLKRRSRIESPYGFLLWIKGDIDPRIFLLIGGMVGVVAAMYLFLHGGGK